MALRRVKTPNNGFHHFSSMCLMVIFLHLVIIQPIFFFSSSHLDHESIKEIRVEGRNHFLSHEDFVPSPHITSHFLRNVAEMTRPRVNTSVDSVFLKFDHYLTAEELSNLSRTLNLSVYHSYVEMPLYLTSYFAYEKLKFLSEHLRTSLVAIYPNMKYQYQVLEFSDKNNLNLLDQGDVTAFGERVLSYVKADDLRSRGFTGKGIKVGIIDTGVDDHHRELEGKIIAKKSFVKEEFGYSETIENASDFFPPRGHGTGVASLIAGKKLGIAPDALLISAKVIHDYSVRGAGNGSAEETTAGILAAIDYLLSQNVDIISISLGQYLNLPDGLRDEYINHVTNNKGIIFVIAAGNYGYSLVGGSSLSNPGTSLQAITVGSSDWDFNPSIFSSEGPRSDGLMKPDLLAPGEEMVYASASDNQEYVIGSGTSFATPVVTGIVALLLDGIKNHLNMTDYTPGLLKSVLMNTSRLLLGNSCRYPPWKQGFGLVNARGAWKLLSSLFDTSKEEVPFFSIISPWNFGYPPNDVIFRGQLIHLPIALISSVPIEVTSIQITDGLTVLKETSFKETSSPIFQGKNSVFFQYDLNVPESFALGMKNLKIYISVNVTNVRLVGHWSVIVKEPRAKILYDVTHSLLAPRGLPPYHSILGKTSTLFGGFREFGQLMENQGILLQDLSEHQEWNVSYLGQYDAFLMLEPATRNWDPFMDWISPNKTFLNLKSDEISSLVEYSRRGGKVIIFARGSPISNVSNVNELLKNWGILISNDDESRKDLRLSSQLSDLLDLTEKEMGYFPTTILELVNVTSALPLLVDDETDELVAVGRYMFSRKEMPDVIVFASSAFIDNFGLKGLYDSRSLSSLEQVFISMIDWILELDPLSDVMMSKDNFCRVLFSEPSISQSFSKDDGLLANFGMFFYIPLGLLVSVMVVSSIKLYKLGRKKAN